MVKFGWETVSVETGDVVGGGLEVLVLDDDGRTTATAQAPGSSAAYRPLGCRSAVQPRIGYRCVEASGAPAGSGPTDTAR